MFQVTSPVQRVVQKMVTQVVDIGGLTKPQLLAWQQKINDGKAKLALVNGRRVRRRDEARPRRARTASLKVNFILENWCLCLFILCVLFPSRFSEFRSSYKSSR